MTHTGTIAEEMQTGLPFETALNRYGENFVCIEKFGSNLALNEGLGELIDLICGLGTPTKWDYSNARLGVGDSNATVVGDTNWVAGIYKQNLQDHGFNLSTAQWADGGVASNLWQLRR